MKYERNEHLQQHQTFLVFACKLLFALNKSFPETFNNENAEIILSEYLLTLLTLLIFLKLFLM